MLIVSYNRTREGMTIGVRARLFCHPEVSVFCQGQALYFVKLRSAENKLTPPSGDVSFRYREQMLPAKSHEALRSLPSVALSSVVGKSP